MHFFPIFVHCDEDLISNLDDSVLPSIITCMVTVHCTVVYLAL